MSNLRIGIGYDVHKLEPNLPFIVGGVKLSHNKGIVAHSDGDIIYHTISDALLGAAALGDIGHFFPDTDLKNKGLDSSVILLEVISKLKKLSYSIVNIDVSLVLEKPEIITQIPGLIVSTLILRPSLEINSSSGASIKS